MRDALRQHVTHGATPQDEPARADQVKNNAGGYTFKVGDEQRLNRFLTIGTDGGTYYVKERPLTRDNASLVIKMAEEDKRSLLAETSAISVAGRAPRNTPALFALAAASGLGSTAYRQEAFDLLPSVARTGYHLLVWAEYAKMFRGRGPQFHKGVRNWYLSKTPEDLAYQLLKYKQREGWSQRNLLHISGLQGDGPRVADAYEAIFRYVMKTTAPSWDKLPALFEIAHKAHETRDVKEWTRLLSSTRSLSWEMLPSEALSQPDVWRTMVNNGNLPLGALLRNLSRLTRLGVLGPMSSGNAEVIAKLLDPEAVKRARIHPISVLIALRSYAMGHGLDGKSSWVPVTQVIDAMDEMFYLAFGTVEPSNKRTAVCLDVSGSMSDPRFSKGHEQLYAKTALTPRVIAAAMSLVTMKAEPQHAVMAFSHGIQPISISPRQRLDDVIRAMDAMPMGGTDCALPMIWAEQNQIAVDTFQIHTDNETWSGRSGHPHEALKRYRKFSGINARLQVVASVATEFSIADPLDPGQLDVSGFDSAVPRLLADHSRGDI